MSVNPTKNTKFPKFIFSANRNNIFIVISPVINETTNPIQFSIDNVIESDNTEYKPAPIVAGIAIKKLRVRASFLLVPRISNTDVVKPDLLSPGIADNPCAIPVVKASNLLILSIFFLGVIFLFRIINPLAIMNIPMIAVNMPVLFRNNSVDTASLISINIGNPIKALTIVDIVKNIVSFVGFFGDATNCLIIFRMVSLKTTIAEHAVPICNHKVIPIDVEGSLLNNNVEVVATTPSELMGSHSVMPCIIPRMTTSNKLMNLLTAFGRHHYICCHITGSKPIVDIYYTNARSTAI